MQDGNSLTWIEANLIFDILVEDAGAYEPMRSEFILYHTAEPEHFPTEWRFQGGLGFGGKFWHARRGWHVSCYPEDETIARVVMMQKVNMRLEALWLST